jgi:hypothetical protein
MQLISFNLKAVHLRRATANQPKKLFVLRFTVTILCLFCFTSVAFSQAKALTPTQTPKRQKVSLKDFRVFARWSPMGAVIGISPVALSSDGRSDTVAALVLRKGANDAEFTQIARIERAPTLEAVKAIAGERAWELFVATSGAKSDQDAWRIIREDRRRTAAALFIPYPSIGSALGMAYIDTSSLKAPDGTRFRYAVRYVLRGGISISVEPQAGVELKTGQTYRSAPPRFVDALESDSVVTLKFIMEHASEQELRLAAIYRQVDGQGEFEQLPIFVSPVKLNEVKTNSSKTSSSADMDAMMIIFDDRVEPEHIIRYFVQMQDGVGNLGARSDTASVISLTQSAIPRITEASAKDTIGGIFLRWKPLAPKPYFLGVQISRADGPESPYTPLDTVSLHDSTYFDKTVYSGHSYFYAIKAIMLRLAQEQPSVWVSSAHRNSSKPPLPVYGLQGEWTTERLPTKDGKRKEVSGVKLHWQASVEQDIANYLVYRGLPGQEMEVISQPIPPGQTMFFDTNSTLNGASLYVYAVRAVNFTGQESSDSKLLRIRPDKPVLMRPPVGLGGYEEYGTVRLQWQPEAQEAYRVAGYKVYRRLIATDVRREQHTNIEQAPATAFLAPAEENAPKFGFKLLMSNATTATFFQDASVKENELYEYAVTALDASGHESGLSSVFRFALTEAELMPPSRVYAREVEKGVELSWSEQTQSKSKKIVIYRRTEQESIPKRLATVDADEVSFLDSSVASNTLYIYFLRVQLPDKRESIPSYEVSVRKE